MRCPDQIQLEAFVDGELPPDAAAMVAAHVAVCAPCGAHVQRIRSLLELLRTHPVEALAEVEVAELVAAARQGASSRRGRFGSPGATQRFAWRESLIAASLALSLAAGVAVYRARLGGPSGTPPDSFSLALLRAHQDYQAALAADSDINAQVALVGW